MAKPNYAFAKRQRDLAKKQKKEEKRLRKQGSAAPPTPETVPPTPTTDKTSKSPLAERAAGRCPDSKGNGRAPDAATTVAFD